MLFKVVSHSSAKKQATVPAELAAQLLEELGKQTANCLKMQHQVANKKAHTAVMQEGHNTYQKFFEFDKGLADEHAQDLAHTESEIEDLKKYKVALVDECDNLFADNECLQAELGAYAE
ncbi:hypothetical protein GGH96_002215 [Coemansia sp. RSA 1972]|nr:hypothetical protein GGH96_002215 [Coemansia sp. RSA 1972]